MIAFSVYAVALLGGLALAVVAIFAFKAKSNLGASLFGWASLTFLLFAATGNAFDGLFSFSMSGSWILWVVIAIFYLIFAVWAYLAETPKLTLAVLVVTALVFLFFGLAMNPSNESSTMETMFLVMGIFAIIDFLLATYLGLALTEEGSGKLKVV